MTKKKVIIIGGGPGGLTATYELLKKDDFDVTLIEQSEYWGGISRTVNYKGNKIDIGGHRFFSKSNEVMNWWKNILPIHSEKDEFVIQYKGQTQSIENESNSSDLLEDIMLVRSRKSRIYFDKQFFDYPITLSAETIKKLGLGNTFLIGISYIKSVISPIKDEKNLEDFFINRFGKRLYEKFFRDYTEKVWGIKCTEISPEWGAQRIKGLSITKTIAHFFKQILSKKNTDISQKNVETSLIEYFLYPKYGPGQMWEKVAKIVEDKGAKLQQQMQVIKIEAKENIIIAIVAKNIFTNEETRFEGDYFVSTMPIKELIECLDSSIPEKIQEISSGLIYRDFVTVGLLLNKMKIADITDNWIYIQEPDVKVGRLQIFNNWSPFMVKDPNTVWVGLEYFCNDTDELWNMSESDMKKLGIKELSEIGLINTSDVIDSVVIKMPKTYPAYFGTYNRFDELKEYVDQFDNLFLIGRNGMHKYNNQDHSMLTAIEAVKNIKSGKKSKENIWSINTEMEYHEEK